VLSKQWAYLAPLERSGFFRDFGFYKHFVPPGLKTEPLFITRTLEPRHWKPNDAHINDSRHYSIDARLRLRPLLISDL